MSWVFFFLIASLPGIKRDWKGKIEGVAKSREYPSTYQKSIDKKMADHVSCHFQHSSARNSAVHRSIWTYASEEAGAKLGIGLHYGCRSETVVTSKCSRSRKRYDWSKSATPLPCPRPQKWICASNWSLSGSSRVGSLVMTSCTRLPSMPACWWRHRHRLPAANCQHSRLCFRDFRTLFLTNFTCIVVTEWVYFWFHFIPWGPWCLDARETCPLKQWLRAWN